MKSNRREKIDSLFESLPPESKTAVIRHGVALYQATLEKRLFLAQAKIKGFEDKYQIALSQLDNKGLPEDANYEMHEDYILWHHWSETAEKLKGQLEHLETITEHGLIANEELYAGY